MKAIGWRYLPAIAAMIVLLLLTEVGGTVLRSRAQEVAANSAEQGCWSAPPSPRIRGVGELRGVEAVAANDVWAVGWYGRIEAARHAYKMLIMHWDGREWSIVPGPNVGTGDSQLFAVAAGSSNDVWAVGSYRDEASGRGMTLTIHWDGTGWTHVPIPGLGSLGQLNSIAVLSRNDAWAVGSWNSSDYRTSNLILHWDGEKWSPPNEIPNPGQINNLLRSVSGASANDVWAVGDSDNDKPVVLRWDGSRWSQVLNVNPDSHGRKFWAVEAAGQNDVWIVGTSTPGGSPILHWDGSAWAALPFPEAGAFYAIDAASANDVWAVGTYGLGNSVHTLAAHWDGKAWNIVPDAPVEREVQVYGGSVTSTGDLWAAGSHYDRSKEKRDALTIRRTGAACISPTHAPISQPLDPPDRLPPAPGADRRFFPETGQEVYGLFLDYWQRNGGLAQQGYPISPVMGEVSELNGRLYTVQYFERAVFEYHPENQPPYNVLLSQLGTLQYRKKYPNGALDQSPNNEPGSILFKETGKRLGGRFLEYWQANGGLAQQGYPISDEFSEKSDLDGKFYTVQYFERAVFEYHPENQKPYDVLLSHLGRFRYEAKYGVATPPAGPQARLLARGVGEKVVSLGGNFYWATDASSNGSVYVYDVKQGRDFAITSKLAKRRALMTDGKIIAWVQSQEGGVESIEGYDPATGAELTIVQAGRIRKFSSVALDGEIVYYTPADGGRPRLYAFNPITGEDRLLSERGANPVARNGRVLWSEEEQRCSPTGSRPPCTTDWRLHLLMRGDKESTVILKDSRDFAGYDISNDHVVWSDRSSGHVYLYDINSGTGEIISSREGIEPTVTGTLVSWTGRPAPAIKVFDINKGTISWLNPRSGLVPASVTISEQGLVVFRTNSGRATTPYDLYIFDEAQGR